LILEQIELNEKLEKIKANLPGLLGAFGALASILACVFSDFVKGHYGKVWEWIKDVPSVSFIVSILVTFCLTFIFVYALVYGLQALIPPISNGLHYALSKYKQHLSKSILNATPCQTIFRRTERAVRGMVAEVLHTHSESSSEVFVAQEGEQEKLLPANFAVYAECVSGLFNLAEKLVNNKLIEKIEFFTYFNKPLQAWYNLYSAVLPCGQSGEQVCHFTSPEWESYKAGNALVQHKGIPLSVLRLVIPQQFLDVSNYYLYTGKDDDKDLISHKIGFKCKHASSIVGKKEFPLKLMDEIQATLSQERRRGILVHLIGLHEDNNPTKGCVPLVNHFQSAYHTGSIKLRKEKEEDAESFVSGVYYGYLEQETEELSKYINHYDDIFAVRITCRKDRQRNFGLAFVNDATRGVSGIYFMPNNKISKFIQIFCEQWNLARSSFPRKKGEE